LARRACKKAAELTNTMGTADPEEVFEQPAMEELAFGNASLEP